MAALAVVLVVSLGPQSAHAYDTGTEGAPSQAAEEGKSSAEGSAKPATDPAAQEVQAAPRLQIQDEGPSARTSDSPTQSRSRMSAVDDAEERPFWKHWIFWAVTGALVVGVVGMAIYTSSGTDASLAACPPDVVVSLGCFGAGR